MRHNILAVDNPTHVFCNRQALKILKKDRYYTEADFFEQFLPVLNKGVVWADTGLKSCCHFYDAERKTGKWHMLNAAVLCELYYRRAISLWKAGRNKEALFYLGAASHLIQDMCVPHHACCVISQGHNRYEKWVINQHENYGVFRNGYYLEKLTPAQWIQANAGFSRELYYYVRINNSEEDFAYATSMLLPHAQRTTSGFLLKFYIDIIRG